MTHRTEDRPLPSGASDEFIDLPPHEGRAGLRMHVVTAGQGPPLLLLHGAPQCHLMWTALLPRYAEHFRVICPDLRGAGWTEAPGSGYDPASLVADLRGLLEAYDLPRAQIVAHDWSGIIAFQLALEEPELVERLVTLSIPDLFTRLDARVLGLLVHGWFDLILPLPVLGPLAVRGGRQRMLRYMQSLTGPTFEGPLPFADVDRARLRDPRRARDLSRLYRTTIVPTLLGLFTGRFRSAHLSVPTLQLMGTADPSALLLRMRRHEGRATDSSMEQIPGAGHFLVDEAGDEVLERTLRFLRTEDSPAVPSPAAAAPAPGPHADSRSSTARKDAP